MISRVKIKSHKAPTRGLLSVVENKDVKFPIKRAFWITGLNESDERGDHAHRRTTQFLVAIDGEVLIRSLDWFGVSQVMKLMQPNEAIVAPPGNWLNLTFSKNCKLLVLTDHVYRESDYIRDKNEFYEISNQLQQLKATCRRSETRA